MKSFLLTIAAVQILHCSGIPSPKDALRASVIKLNRITETTNLCGITRRRVKDINHTGKLSYKVDLTFSVKETVCSKNSGLEFDDPSCRFRSKKTAEKGWCRSRVEYFADEVLDVDVQCRGLKTVDSNSDSSESSKNRIEVETKSKERSIEETPDAGSKSIESSLEESRNAESRSIESSLEESRNMKSKSAERSLDVSSYEDNDDSRARH
ncbi:secreted phosphoprotein 24-like [Cetorhinus maximus]